jgi:glyoxylase-like metal-dependent hydrolase (beta-lactamase superfamily II)
MIPRSLHLPQAAPYYGGARGVDWPRFARDGRAELRTKEQEMQVSQHVRAVQVPDDNPMHPLYTNLFLVGGEQTLLVDSGESLERYRWMLRGYLAASAVAGERQAVDTVGITHHHFDHSGNLIWARETLHAEIAVPPAAVKLLRGKLPKEGVRLVADGEVIDLGGVRLRVIFTPGHTVDSICYYLEDEGVLFTGDTFLGGSTTTVSDLGAYRRSLRTLVELPNLKVIGPGHGPIVQEPRARLEELLRHRELRDRQILQALDDGRPQSAWDIMLKVYPDLNKRLRRAATGNVLTHLRQFEQEGRVKARPGRPRVKNPEREQREAARAKERAAVLKQAKKIEAEDLKARLRAQETPPTDTWAVLPKYELVGRAKE